VLYLQSSRRFHGVELKRSRESFTSYSFIGLLVNVAINFWTQYTNELGISSMRCTLLIDNPERLRGYRGNSIKHTVLPSYCDISCQQRSRSPHTTKKGLWLTRRILDQYIDCPTVWKCEIYTTRLAAVKMGSHSWWLQHDSQVGAESAIEHRSQ